MEVQYKSEHPVTAESVRKHTGKTWDDWFAALDQQGGPAKGRRVLGDYLVKEAKVDAWWTTTILVAYEAARNILEKDGQPKGYNICVTKTIAAPPDKVFASFAAGGWLGKGGQADVREAGQFKDDGGRSGLFKKVTPGKLLRFTFQGKEHAAGELVEIKLTASSGKCGVVLTHDRLPTREAADGMRAAWGEILTAMKGQLE